MRLVSAKLEIRSSKIAVKGAKERSVRCHCRKGSAKANQEQWREFDAGLDVPALQDERRLVASCVAFAESVANRGRVPSFDAWNQQEATV